MLALLIIAVTSAWAQDEVTVNPTANANEWTLEMPDADVELEVTYYTDEELAEMEEAAFTAGVELTKASNGEWSLAEMPGFDIELEVEYETDLALNEVDDIPAILDQWDGCEADVTLTRTLATEKWYSLCLPFNVDLTADGPLKGVTAKTLGSVTNDGTTLTVTFGEAVTTLEAGKPYIVRLPDDATMDIVNPLFVGATISKTLTDVVVSGATFKGTYAPVTLPKPDKTKLFLQDNKLYYPWTDDATVNAFRAYIVLDAEVPGDASAPNIVINFDGDDNGKTTGITTTDCTDLTDSNEWYTLDGREISGKPTAKGVYIHKGRKEVVR